MITKSDLHNVIVIDGDLVMQGLTADTIFFGAWDEIYKQLEREFWASEFSQVRSLVDFVEYEQDGRIICYLNDHANEGKTIAHCVN